MLDLTGRTFGRWTVLERSPQTDRHGFVLWLCRCNCGTHRAVLGGSLAAGRSQSCGCLKAEVAREFVRATKIIHGDSKLGRRGSLYDIWASMGQRCNNPTNHAYQNYGGRGIRMCGHWRRSYAAFKFWMGQRPSPAHTVDRIDNDGDYEPGNVRWATRADQNRNSRRCRRLVEEGPKIAYS